jgi:putative two-component system response regulator
MTKVDSAKILIVDDEEYVCELVSRWLSARGHECTTASTAEKAIDLLSYSNFDLMITDIMMPGMSGIDLLAFVKARFPDMAVIIITALGDDETATMTFDLGAWGYVSKPFESQDVLLNVSSALERRRGLLRHKEHEQVLKEKAQEQTDLLKRTQNQLISVLIRALSHHSDETVNHVKRIGICAGFVAKYLLWDSENVERIQIAAQLHDVGKIAISDTLLQKPGKLTPDEFETVKSHTTIGATILEASDLPVIQMAREIALSHHERWDGSGYPHGSSGAAAPESARIVSILDVYDALTNDKPYRRAFTQERALSIMNAYRSSFDPRIFDYFVSLLPKIHEIQENLKD